MCTVVTIADCNSTVMVTLNILSCSIDLIVLICFVLHHQLTSKDHVGMPGKD